MNQSRLTIYNDVGREALYAVVTTQLVDIRHEEIASWSNSSDSEQKYKHEYKDFSMFRVTKGEEVSTRINLATGVFTGLTIHGEHSQIRFSREEATGSITGTVEVAVAPHRDLYFYQRKYTFLVKVTYILDGWGKLCDVGSLGGFHIQESICDVEIYTREWFTRSTPLIETRSEAFEGQAKTGLAGMTCKFEDLTEKARDTMRSMGIDGRIGAGCHT